MAVRVYDRSEGKLKVAIEARSLVYAVMNGLKNEKHMPKSQRWIIGIDIKKDAIDVYRNIRKANRINPSIYEDYLMRRTLMIEAQNSLEALSADINIALDLGYLAGLSLGSWQDKMDEVSRLLIAWRKSDRHTYDHLIPKNNNQ